MPHSLLWYLSDNYRKIIVINKTEPSLLALNILIQALLMRAFSPHFTENCWCG